MRLSQYIEREPAKRKKSRSKPSGALTAIAAQRFFVPAVCAWGAALLGLSIVVLPDAAINRITVLTSLGFLGSWAKFAYASVAALFGAGIAYFASGSMHERARASDESVSVVTAVNSRRSDRVDPINPATDLGSESLDAPIEDGEFEELREDCSASDAKRQPTLGELSKRGYEMEAPEDVDGDDNGGDALFTRKHFQSALIETCEGEACEAATCEAAGSFSDDDGPVADEAEAESDSDMAQVTTTAKRDDNPAPIGSPAAPSAGASWSLTQFTPPSPQAAPQPEKAAPNISAFTQSGEASPVKVVPDPEPLPEKPQALDLGEFAELPSRNAVWVEEPSEEAVQTPERAPAPVRAPVPASALEKLRERNPEELSLVEMVERFAGALHEHQEAERASIAKSGPTRDAALAEALKALTLFTENGFDKGAPAADPVQLGQTERELRDALVKLQGLRGEQRGAA